MSDASEWHNGMDGCEERQHSASRGGVQGGKGFLTSRSTRKEEFEYLDFILGKSKTPKNGSLTARGRLQGGSTREADAIQTGESKGRKGAGNMGRTLRLAKAKNIVSSSSEAQRPLAFQKISSLYDVAAWSDFSSSQDFAGKGVAALCSIRQDRDLMYNTGAIQYMIELLLNGRSPQAKCDACDALVELVKNDLACRAFVSWTGTDPKDGSVYISGLDVVIRLKDAKQPNLQRSGATLLNTVLLSDSLKPMERVEPEKIEGVCSFAYASDAAASKCAAKTLVGIIWAVLDTGVRWTESVVHPILKLLKDGPPNPRVEYYALKAISMICKEGDRACALLSEVGCVKTLSLLLASRTGKAVDMDDVFLIRVITQICEVDNNKFEDAVLLGGVPRMLYILRKHLITHSILLPHELEVQRRTTKFLEKMVARTGLGKSLFEAGTCGLCLDIMDMERSTCKASALNTLAALTTDLHVQGNWHTLHGLPSNRLAVYVNSHDISLRIKAVEMLGNLCNNEEAAKTMIKAPGLLEYIINAMEDGCKMQERVGQNKLLTQLATFLLRLSHFDFGRQHIRAWNTIPRMDPNLRKVRGLLSQHRELDDMWRTYDQFVSNMSAVAASQPSSPIPPSPVLALQTGR